MELNHRPIGLQPIALPLSYSPRTLVQLLLKEIIARALWTRGRFRPGLHQRLNGCVRVPPPMHPATYNNPLKKKERKKKKKKKKEKKEGGSQTPPSLEYLHVDLAKPKTKKG